MTNVTDEKFETGIIAYLGLGANLGDRSGNLQAALAELAACPQVDLVRTSSLYQTPPVGITDQPDFLNLVAEVRTSLPPQELLPLLLHIENGMGRVRNIRWGPRVIDIDLLLYGDQQIELPGLTVPHPRLRERAFVLVPLAELAPDLLLPGSGESVSHLAEVCADRVNIRRLFVV